MIVGLCSTYREGPLAYQAAASLVEACDEVLCLEGPAGEPLTEQVPETELPLHHDRVRYREGRWRSDARKRQAHLEWARSLERAPGESLWGVIVDGDELLFNGRFLGDWLRRLDWHEQVNPDARYIGRPMRIVELDGSVGWVRGRLLRLDRIREYKVSTSVFVVDGQDEAYAGGGNLPDSYSDWAVPRTGYFERDQMLMRPPLPSEPYLVHRSLLRHPLRSGLRLHEQEKAELARAGMPL